MNTKLVLESKDVEYVCKSYIDISEFETNIGPSDKSDQMYLLSATVSGTFKISNGTEYKYVTEMNTFVTKA
jgi:hypothetical protein